VCSYLHPNHYEFIKTRDAYFFYSIQPAAFAKDLEIAYVRRIKSREYRCIDCLEGADPSMYRTALGLEAARAFLSLPADMGKSKRVSPVQRRVSMIGWSP
jgi:hypothetical protein